MISVARFVEGFGRITRGKMKRRDRKTKGERQRKMRVKGKRKKREREKSYDIGLVCVGPSFFSFLG